MERRDACCGKNAPARVCRTHRSAAALRRITLTMNNTKNQSNEDGPAETLAVASGSPLFRRVWAMPNGDTFTVKPIGEMVRRYLAASKISVDPFARNKRWATHTNDLNPATEAEHHMDSIAFLQMLVDQGVMADCVIFDPPYSPRQIKECYNSIGIKMGALDAMRTNWMRERDLIAKMQKPGDIVVSCNWNSMGMGKKRNYEMIEGLLVCHGVGHNDTIIIAERRLPDLANK